MLSHFKKLILYLLLPALAGTVFLNTGLRYLPVEVTTGKCFMDYRQPSAYQERSEKLRQLDIELQNGNAILCYSSTPDTEAQAGGTQIRFGEAWQMGMYEPTRLYTNRDLWIGDLFIPKGRYSMFAIPQRTEWQLIISSSITHWGPPVTTAVRSQEVGSTLVRRQFLRHPSDELTFRTEDGFLIMDYAQTRLQIPIRAAE